MNRNNLYVNAICKGMRIIEHIVYSSNEEFRMIVQNLAKKYFLLEDEISETILTKGIDLTRQRKMYFEKNQNKYGNENKERSRIEHKRIANKKNQEVKAPMHEYTYDYHLVDFNVYRTIRDLSKENPRSLERNSIQTKSKLKKPQCNKITKVTIEDNKQITFNGKSILTQYSKNIPIKSSKSRFLNKFVTISTDSYETNQDKVNLNSRILSFRREFQDTVKKTLTNNSKSFRLVNQSLNRDQSKNSNRSTTLVRHSSEYFKKLYNDAYIISESKKRLHERYNREYSFRPNISKKPIQINNQYSDTLTNFLNRQNQFHAIKTIRNLERESQFASQFSFKPNTYSESKSVSHFINKI